MDTHNILLLVGIFLLLGLYAFLKSEGKEESFESCEDKDEIKQEKEVSETFGKNENPKKIFENEVLTRPESVPLAARWMAAAWSPKGELPIALRGNAYTTGLKSLTDPSLWLEIDPNAAK